jgi:DNA-binding MarR family transcriptional regulator
MSVHAMNAGFRHVFQLIRVTQGHEVSSPTEPGAHQSHLDELLLRIEEKGKVSQRSLARELGIALGLTNVLLRRLAQLGWIQIERLNRNHARYLVTPLGLAQRALVKQHKLEQALRSYADARDRIRASLDRLSTEWPANSLPEKRIVFFGANALTEIASVCLKGTDLRLVAVVDDQPTSTLVDGPILSTDRLSAGAVDGLPYDRLVIMRFEPAASLQQRLDARGIPAAIQFWL